MRAARVIVALALAIALGLVGLWIYRAERPADAVAAQPAPLAPPVAPVEEAVAPARTEELQAAAFAVVETPAKKASSSFSTFRGRVIDAATREAVQEFVIEFHGTQVTKAGEEAPGARAFRTDDGRFEWDYLPPGSWRATVSASGYQRFDLAWLRLSPGQSTPEVVMPLRAGHVLHGRVYDENTGAGIPEATVQFREATLGRWEGNFRMRPQDKTGKDGSFELDGVPPGRITLTVYAQNYAGTELDVAVAEDTPPVDIALVTGGSIAGRLTAADGVTAVTGNVGVMSQERHSGSARPTGNDGQFSFVHLEPGRYRVTGQAAAGSVVREIVLGRGQRIENLVLSVGASGRAIRGVVSGVRPDQISQVTVSVHRDDAMAGHSVRIDELGAYTMSGVAPGDFSVVAEITSRVQLSRRVTLTGDSDLTVDFAFPPGARVSGRVTRQGRPVRSVHVYPRPLVEVPERFHYGTHTSNEGAYVIEQLSPGEYYFHAGDFRSKLLRVSGDTTFDIEIPDVQLSGRVVEGGKVPVVGAHVELWDSNPDGQHIHVQEQTDHFGGFELIGIEPGDYMLTAYKPGYAMYRERFTYTAPVADLVLPVQRDKGIEIRIRYADTGKAAENVYVVERQARQHGTRLHLRLDEFGLGYVPAALSGKTLSVASGNYEPVVIPNWSGQSLDLKLLPRKNTDTP